MKKNGCESCCCCCCCCCPPAIQALITLLCRSGCSQATVAAALTFFPPSPPLYSFERLSKDGEKLSSYDEYGSDFAVDAVESEIQLVEMDRDGDGPITQKSPENGKVSNSSEDEDEKNQNPFSKLTEQNQLLKARAKKRYLKDKLDSKNKVTYKFVPDSRLRNPPSFDGRKECFKLHCTKSKSYIAVRIYRVNENDFEEGSKKIKTILYSHGNATDLGAMNMMQCLLARGLGVNIIMYDYSGYGESGGLPRERNTYHNIETVYMYAVEHLADGIPEDIILYGQSVGSGPTCYLASQKPVGGVILHSPFMSGIRVLTPNRVLACLDIFPNIDRIKKIKCPIFIIHGMQDEEVDVSHGFGLYEAVKEDYKFEPWWVPDRGHNDITDGSIKMTEYLRRLKKFIETLTQMDPTEPSLDENKMER